MKILNCRRSFQGEKNHLTHSNKKKYFAFLISLSVLTVSLHQPILRAYGAWLSQESVNVDSDIIVALGGTNRIETAEKLVRQGKSNMLYVDSISAEYFQQLSQRTDTSKVKIFWGGHNPETTFGEARAFSKVLEKYQLKPRSITIVTSKYHLRRSKWVFDHVLGNSIEVKTFSAYDLSDTSYGNWWEDEASRKWVLSETKKLLFYITYYGVLGSKDSWNVPESFE